MSARRLILGLVVGLSFGAWAPVAAQPLPGYGERWRDSGPAWHAVKGTLSEHLRAEVELKPGEWLWIRDENAGRLRIEVVSRGEAELEEGGPQRGDPQVRPWPESDSPQVYLVADPRSAALGPRELSPPLDRSLLGVALECRLLAPEDSEPDPDSQRGSRAASARGQRHSSRKDGSGERSRRLYLVNVDQPGSGFLALRARARGRYRLQRLQPEVRAESWERWERALRAAGDPEQDWPQAWRWPTGLPGAGVIRFANRQASVLPWAPEQDQSVTARRLRLAHFLLTSPLVRPHLRGSHLERWSWDLEGPTFRDGPLLQGHGDPSDRPFTYLEQAQREVSGPAVVRVLARGTASAGGAPPRLPLRLALRVGATRETRSLLPRLDLRVSEALLADDELQRSLGARGLSDLLLTSAAEVRVRVPPGRHRVSVASLTSGTWLSIQTLVRVESWDLRSPEGFLPETYDSGARGQVERVLAARLRGDLEAASEGLQGLLDEDLSPSLRAWVEVEALELALAQGAVEPSRVALERVRRRLVAGELGSEALAQRGRVALLAAVEAGWTAPLPQIAWAALRSPAASPQDAADALVSLALSSSGARLELGSLVDALGLSARLQSRVFTSARRAWGAYRLLPRELALSRPGRTFVVSQEPWRGSEGLERVWRRAQASASPAFSLLVGPRSLGAGPLEVRPLDTELQLPGQIAPLGSGSRHWLRLARGGRVETSFRSEGQPEGTWLARGPGVPSEAPQVTLAELPALRPEGPTAFKLPPGGGAGLVRITLGLQAEEGPLDVAFAGRVGDYQRELRLIRLRSGAAWAQAEFVVPERQGVLELERLAEGEPAFGRASLSVIGRRSAAAPGLPLLPLASYFLAPGGADPELLVEPIAAATRDINARSSPLQQSRARWERACLLARLDQTHTASRELARLRDDAYHGSRARHSLAALHLIQGSLGSLEREVATLEGMGHRAPSLTWLSAASALPRSRSEAAARLRRSSPPPLGTLDREWYRLLEVELGDEARRRPQILEPSASLPRLMTELARLRRWSEGAPAAELLGELRRWRALLSEATLLALGSQRRTLARRLARLEEDAQQAVSALSRGQWPPSPGTLDPFAPWAAVEASSLREAPGEATLESAEARWRVFAAPRGARLRARVQGPLLLELRWRHAFSSDSAAPGCALLRLKGLPGGDRTRVVLEGARSTLGVAGAPQLTVSFSDVWRVRIPPGVHELSLAVEVGAGFLQLRRRGGRAEGAWGIPRDLAQLPRAPETSPAEVRLEFERADRDLARALIEKDPASLLEALVRYSDHSWGGSDDAHTQRHRRLLRRLTRRRRIDLSAWLPRTRTLLLSSARPLTWRQALFHPFEGGGGTLLTAREPALWRAKSDAPQRFALEVVADRVERLGPAQGEARLTLRQDRGPAQSLRIPLGERRLLPLGEARRVMLEATLEASPGSAIAARARLVQIGAEGPVPVHTAARTRWHRALRATDISFPGPGLLELERFPLASLTKVEPGVWRPLAGVAPVLSLHAVRGGRNSRLHVRPGSDLVRLLRHEVREERLAAWGPQPPSLAAVTSQAIPGEGTWPLPPGARGPHLELERSDQAWVLEPWLRGDLRRRAGERPSDDESVSDELRLGLGLHHRYRDWPLFERYRLSVILPEGQGPVGAADLRWQAYLSESPRISLRFLGQAFFQASEVGSALSEVGDLRLRSNFRLADPLRLVLDLHLNAWATSVSRRRGRLSRRELYRRIQSDYRRDHPQWSEAVVRLRWTPWQNLRAEGFAGLRTNRNLSYGDVDRWWAGVSALTRWEILYLRASYVHLERLADADRAQRSAEELFQVRLAAEGWVASWLWVSLEVGGRYAHPSSALSLFFQVTLRLEREGERLHAVDPELVAFWRHQDGSYPWPQR